MKKQFFTVGPTQVHHQMRAWVEEALDQNIMSISHRSEFFTTMVGNIYNGISRLFSMPKDWKIFFFSSGTEVMERIIQNCVETYSYHLVNGAFSNRFYRIAVELKKQAEALIVADGTGFDNRLPENPNKPFELVTATINESSSGVQMPDDFLQTLRNKFPKALIAADLVSLLPTYKIPYDLVDMAFFSVQKGFSLPAGLAVLMVSPKVLERAIFLKEDRGISIGSFRSLPKMDVKMKHNFTIETPNVFNIFLLEKALNLFLEHGQEKLLRQMKDKAKFIYDFLEKNDQVEIFVKDKKWRSQTVLVGNLKKGKGHDLVHKLGEKGFLISPGYAKYKDSQIRIANFPIQTQDMLQALFHTWSSIYPK